MAAVCPAHLFPGAAGGPLTRDEWAGRFGPVRRYALVIVGLKPARRRENFSPSIIPSITCSFRRRLRVPAAGNLIRTIDGSATGSFARCPILSFPRRAGAAHSWAGN